MFGDNYPPGIDIGTWVPWDPTEPCAECGCDEDTTRYFGPDGTPRLCWCPCHSEFGAEPSAEVNVCAEDYEVLRQIASLSVRLNATVRVEYSPSYWLQGRVISALLECIRDGHHYLYIAADGVDLFGDEVHHVIINHQNEEIGFHVSPGSWEER